MEGKGTMRVMPPYTREMKINKRISMKKLTLILCVLTLILGVFLVIPHSTETGIDGLRPTIEDIISTKQATFGIGIYDFQHQDTLLMSPEHSFVLMSVVKFPQAIALLKQVDEGNFTYDHPIHFTRRDLLPRMYSPLREERTEASFELSLVEALSYSVSKSDNNVCDKLFTLLGSPHVVEQYLQSLGLADIKIGTTYADIGTIDADMSVKTIYDNRSTPQDMLELLRMFYDGELLSKESTDILWQKLIETSTAPNRIKGLLPEGTIVGHKPGTSGKDKTGKTVAYNDIGIIQLPNGNHVAIVIFIADSKESDASNARTIAEISKAIYDYLSMND